MLKDVVRRLEARGVPYMLTGSFAANAYARPRMTRDIDIVIELPERAADAFSKAFEGDYYCDPDMVRDAARAREMFNVIHNGKIVKIDFIVKKNSPFHSQAFERRRVLFPAGFPVWIIAPEDLILSKLDWARDSLSEMQLNDVRSLMRSVESLDRVYVENWVAKLDLGRIYDRMRP